MRPTLADDALMPADAPLASPSPEIAITERTIRRVVLGDIVFDTWYPSYYPEELVGRQQATLYVCQWCFKYCVDDGLAVAHRTFCTAQSPPGRPIYQHGDLAIWEVDGDEHRLFTQNLSLFAKLFLDNKSVFFDVTSFHYYLLVHTDVSGTRQIVGFFSKEKMSWDSNNLACILVFPPWQRNGLGKVLMGVSYLLSRREGRYGGPEKPLSELGRRGYTQFWEIWLARHILKLKGRCTLDVESLARESWIACEDVIPTLRRMHILGPPRKDGSVSVTKRAIREWAKTNDVDLRAPADEHSILA